MRHSLYKYYSETQWAEQFLGGDLLFRSLSYYRAFEDAVRGDPNEGASIYHPSEGLVIHNETQGTTSTLANTAFVSAAKQDEIFVFCMSRAKSQELASEFNSPVCVEVRDIPGFCRRIQAALPSGATFVARRVDYYDSEAGPGARWALPEKIATSKVNAYAPQQEFRLVFTLGDALAFQKVATTLVQGHPTAQTSAPQEYKLRVNALRDIATLCQI